MLKISACIIVKNEQCTIKKCLDSVKGVNEIIILDTGSTDQTVDICRKSKALIYYTTFEDDFSQARNQALGYCTGNWILSIDADEVLMNDVEDLYKIIEMSFGKKVINVQIAEAGLVTMKPRLFKKDSEIKWTGKVAETLTCENAMDSNIKISHTPKVTNLVRNERILREWLAVNRYCTQAMFALGKILHDFGNYEGSLYWLDNYVSNSHKTRDYTSWAYFLQAQSYFKLGRRNRGEDMLLKAIQANPDFSQAYSVLYDVTKDEKYKDMAEKSADKDVLYKRLT